MQPFVEQDLSSSSSASHMYATEPALHLVHLAGFFFHFYLQLFNTLFVRGQCMASVCRRLFFSLYGQTNLKSNKHILSNQKSCFFNNTNDDTCACNDSVGLHPFFFLSVATRPLFFTVHDSHSAPLPPLGSPLSSLRFSLGVR